MTRQTPPGASRRCTSPSRRCGSRTCSSTETIMTTSSDAGRQRAPARRGAAPRWPARAASRLRSSASATSTSTTPAASPRIVRANDAWKPQPKSPTRLPAKVGTWRRICQRRQPDAEACRRRVPWPFCRNGFLRASRHGLRLTRDRGRVQDQREGEGHEAEDRQQEARDAQVVDRRRRSELEAVAARSRGEEPAADERRPRTAPPAIADRARVGEAPEPLGGDRRPSSRRRSATGSPCRRTGARGSRATGRAASSAARR